MCLHVCVSGVCVSVGVTLLYDTTLTVHYTRWMMRSMMSLMGRGFPAGRSPHQETIQGGAHQICHSHLGPAARALHCNSRSAGYDDSI